MSRATAGLWSFFAATWSASALASPCEGPVPPARVASELDEALVSFAVMDQEAFERATDQAVAAVGCVQEPISRELAASLHRVRGIRVLITGNEADGTAALVASARLVPDHQLSETIAPAGGRIALAWAAAKTAAPVARVDLPDPELQVLVDGLPAGDYPASGPYVLPVLTPGGPAASRYVPTGWTLPGEPAAANPMPSPAPAPMPAPVASSSHGGGNKALLWSGVVTGGVAAGLYGTAAISRLAYDQDPSAGGRSLTNATYIGSVGTAALSGVLFTTFFATR
jgi:hypothetical protein